MSDAAVTAKRILGNVEQVIIGKRQQIVLALVAYFCEGHILGCAKLPVLGRKMRFVNWVSFVPL